MTHIFHVCIYIYIYNHMVSTVITSIYMIFIRMHMYHTQDRAQTAHVRILKRNLKRVHLRTHKRARACTYAYIREHVHAHTHNVHTHTHTQESTFMHIHLELLNNCDGHAFLQTHNTFSIVDVRMPFGLRALGFGRYTEPWGI